MFFLRFKTGIRTACALLLGVGVCLAVKVKNALDFPEIDGKRTFYLQSASSQAEMREELSLFDIFRVQGESVRFEIGAQNGEKLAREIAQRLGAEILIEERACGVVSLYGFSPRLGGGVCVNGKNINLHIAFSEENTARQAQMSVGSPIIFGGF